MPATGSGASRSSVLPVVQYAWEFARLLSLLAHLVSYWRCAISGIKPLVQSAMETDQGPSEVRIVMDRSKDFRATWSRRIARPRGIS